MGEAIFRFLFKYPPVAYSRGHLALASGWPGWLLILAILFCTAALGHYIWHRRPPLPVKVRLIVWGLQAAVLGVLLLMLWRPALIVAMQMPQQNVVGVLVDDSSSMKMADGGTPRIEEVKRALSDSGPLLKQLRRNFQVRLYRFSNGVSKIRSAADLAAAGSSTHLQESVAQTYGDLRHLPLAGMIVISDGSENGAFESRTLLDDLKARRIPVYTLGVGKPEFDRDIQVDDVTMPRAALPGTVVSSTVTVRQRGFVGERVQLQVKDGQDVLKTKQIQFGASPVETVPLNFVPKAKSLREYSVSVSPMPGEMLRENNSQSRLVEVENRTARILYVEGEPRWEYKFLRRSLDDDPSLHLVSLLRTSETKFYRQGIDSAQELGDTLPERKELFKYDGLIIGSIRSSFFSPQQQKDLYDFVSRRGGGILFLGGRYALGEGGYQSTALADLLPLQIAKEDTGSSMHHVPAQFQLNDRGLLQLQLADDETANRKNWEKLPALGDYQDTGDPKPGAVVLADAVVEGKHHHVLASQRFGRGRTILFATDGAWRWRMQLESTNHSPETFWRQLLHSLVNDSPQPVSVAAEKPLYLDEQQVLLQAEVYDEKFEPVNGAEVTATVYSPDATKHEVPLELAVEEDGVFRGSWQAVPKGVYRVEVAARVGDKEIGRGESYFQRADGGLEYFSAEQNVPFLTRVAEQTGGKYYPLEQASALPEQLTYSPAGVTVPQVRDLWDMPAFLFLLLLVKGTEWVLRKRWRSV